ncbi:MAG: hypothetical protein AUJ12_09410 [Alphaproteobacteria bacterium CG1_02_46_17]|nr:MAG: hypothetical protein AUJ12_09410 [Alphaproteobacteria bacterium CG1_02_46_17]
MRNKILWMSLVMVLVLCLQSQTTLAEDLTITNDAGNQISLDVEVADNSSSRARGLMFRRTMPETSGMLFIFPDMRQPSFWMKNTLIPLDMLFLDENGQVVDIHNMAMPQDLTTITSSQPAKAVLEINGGMAEKWGIGLKSKISSNSLAKSLE